MYFLVYAFFMCEMQKIFFLRDMMDNQCANIFSTHATVYGSHSVKFAFIERDNIFFMCILNLVFFLKKLGLCLFLYPHSLYFSPKLFFPKFILFFLFLQGKKLFFNLCGSQGELLLFIGGVVSIFYRVKLFCVPLILYFLLSFIAYIYSLFSCLCQCVTKRERSR